LPAQRALMTRWIHSPYRTVCAVPDWFGAAQPDWPASARQVDFPVALGEAWTPPAALEAFLATGTRPLVVSACTGAGAASTFFLRAIEAATQLGERVVVVSRFLEQIPRPLPPTAMLIDYAPFDWLLPRTRGLIHNGGIGTSVLAMRAGIPQIVVPFAYDQYYNAMRLAALGVSVTVRRQRSATELADAAQKLLASPSTVSACERLRGTTLNASGGLQALADLVESAPVIQ
jgi:rhamnosyltransferase subunit B